MTLETMPRQSKPRLLRRQRLICGLDEPLGYPDGLNAYTVDLNSPTDKADPSGLLVKVKTTILPDIDLEKFISHILSPDDGWWGFTFALEFIYKPVAGTRRSSVEAVSCTHGERLFHATVTERRDPDFTIFIFVRELS